MKKTKTKKKAPKRRRRRGARRASSSIVIRRRRNPADGVSIGSIVAGVVGGGVLAGAADYLLAGQTWAATPTRRAMIDGAATIALGATAAATSGFARGAAAGAAGAFGGLCVANLARVVGEASLSSGGSKASGQTTQTTPTVTLDQGSMSGLILPRAARPAPAPAPAPARQPERMSAVVMDRGRMRALVVDPTAAMQAARRAGVAPAMLEAPRMVRPATPGGRMGQLLVRGISR